MSQAQYDQEFAKRQAGMPRWAEEQREKKEHARLLTSLTPAQRLNLEMRENELEAKQKQQNVELEWRADQARQQRLANLQQALAGMAAQANAQVQANQAHQQALGDAIILQGFKNATTQPRTYDSTVTPTYPGGPTYVHTEQTGGN